MVASIGSRVNLLNFTQDVKKPQFAPNQGIQEQKIAFGDNSAKSDLEFWGTLAELIFAIVGTACTVASNPGKAFSDGARATQSTFNDAKAAFNEKWPEIKSLLKKAKIGGEQALSTPGNFLRYLQQNGAFKTANGNPILAPAFEALLNVMPAKNYVRQSNASGGSNQSGGTPTPKGRGSKKGRRGPENPRDELTARIARYEGELNTLRSSETNNTNTSLRQVKANTRAIKNAEFEIAKANVELTRLKLSDLQAELPKEIGRITDGNNTSAQALQSQICELEQVLESQISNIKINFPVFRYP